MRKFLAFLGAVIATVSLAGGAGASAASKPSGPDLSSPTAIASYLTSKGIDPSTVVTQTGLNNYAGPNCPGLGWTCTTSTRVVQVAAPGGQNVDECTPPEGFIGPGDCVVLQTEGGRNTAKCIQHTGTVQHCMITQGGTRNFARIDQLVKDNGGAGQTAIQTADVTQTAESDKNELQLYQEIDQQTNQADDNGLQSQEAHQLAVVRQFATVSANNFAHTHQSQTQDEGGSAATQHQNTGPVPQDISTDPGTPFLECAGPAALLAPNMCARIEQTTDSGHNDGHIHQLASQDEKASNDAHQQQGNAIDGEGASFEQTADSDGSNVYEAVQHKQQHAKSNGGSAEQFDPVRCCGVSQNGGAHDRNDATQLTVQSASGGTYEQIGDVIGHTDADTSTVVVPGDASAASATPTTSGMAICSVSQHVHQNDTGRNGTDTQSGPFCQATEIAYCFSASPGTDTSAATQPDTCAPSTCSDCLTNGADLPAFDVTADPPSYSLPSWYENF